LCNKIYEGKIMKPEACRRCIGRAETAEEVLAILNSPPEKCANCSDAAVLRVVCEQYQMRTPHWWLVDGALAVPIWVVELLNHHVDFTPQPAPINRRETAIA
jgi:hypothetical protein